MESRSLQMKPCLVACSPTGTQPHHFSWQIRNMGAMEDSVGMVQAGTMSYSLPSPTPYLQLWPIPGSGVKMSLHPHCQQDLLSIRLSDPHPCRCRPSTGRVPGSLLHYTGPVTNTGHPAHYQGAQGQLLMTRCPLKCKAS